MTSNEAFAREKAFGELFAEFRSHAHDLRGLDPTWLARIGYDVGVICQELDAYERQAEEIVGRAERVVEKALREAKLLGERVTAQQAELQRLEELVAGLQASHLGDLGASLH